MTDKKEYWDCADDMGTVKISEEVIASIAAISVMGHSGVYSLSSGLGADLAELLGKKTLTRGVKIIFFENALKIDIYFVIKFGFAVCEVAKEVQQSVKSAVESMTGLTVGSVNIHVTGISFEKDAVKAKESEPEKEAAAETAAQPVSQPPVSEEAEKEKV